MVFSIDLNICPMDGDLDRLLKANNSITKNVKSLMHILYEQICDLI
jgi:hypothetical protein